MGFEAPEVGNLRTRLSVCRCLEEGYYVTAFSWLGFGGILTTRRACCRENLVVRLSSAPPLHRDGIAMFSYGTIHVVLSEYVHELTLACIQLLAFLCRVMDAQSNVLGQQPDTANTVKPALTRHASNRNATSRACKSWLPVCLEDTNALVIPL